MINNRSPVPMTGSETGALLSQPRLGKLRRHAGETEIAAAERVAPASGGMRLAILALIAEASDAPMLGLADDEVRRVAAARGRRMAWSSVSARRGELVETGLVEDSGQRRRSDMGNPAIVWRVTDVGRDALGGLGMSQNRET